MSLPFNFVNFKVLDYSGKFFFKGSPQHFDQFPGSSVNTFQADRNEVSWPLIILRNSDAISLIGLTDCNLRTAFSAETFYFLIFVCHLYEEIQCHCFDAIL